MSPEESNALLDARWPAVEGVVKAYGGDPANDLRRDGVLVHVRIISAPRAGSGAEGVRDPYVFRLHFADYDDHAARIQLCDPQDWSRVGTGKQFYPLIDGNSVFNHATFLCMPGDRRCYEQGNHAEWKLRRHYHPEVVIESLFEILRLPGYRGRAP